MTEKELQQLHFETFCEMLKKAALTEAVVIYKDVDNVGVMHVVRCEFGKSPLFQGIAVAVSEILSEHLSQAQNN